MRFALRVLLLALSFTIGTWILGWWSVPLFAAVGAAMARHVRHQAMAAALAAVVAWTALLGWNASQGSVWSFSRIAGGAMGISAVTLILGTLLFPAALAWMATVAAQFVARVGIREPQGGMRDREFGENPSQSTAPFLVLVRLSD